MNAMKQALIAAHRECPDFPVDRPIPSTSFWCLKVRSEQQVGPDHQRCTKCREIKPFEAFHLHTTRRSGRHPRCKACRSAYMKEWRIAS